MEKNNINEYHFPDTLVTIDFINIFDDTIIYHPITEFNHLKDKIGCIIETEMKIHGWSIGCIYESKVKFETGEEIYILTPFLKEYPLNTFKSVEEIFNLINRIKNV